MQKTTGETKFLTDKPKGIKRLHTEKEYARQQRLLLALEDVSKVLTVEVDLQKILEDMATIVAKAVGAKWVNFWELTPDKKATYITAQYGMKPSYVKQSRQQPIQLGKAWIGRAIQTGRAWGTNDILTDPNLLKDLGLTWESAVKKQDYRALLCVPTISRKGPVGGMCVYYPDVHEFTDFEMRLVTIAANQAATSITNTQIFDDLTSERNKTISVINSLSDGLIMYDLDGKITMFNPRAEELLWIESSDVFNMNPEKLSTKNNPSFKNIKDISVLPLKEFEAKELIIKEPKHLILTITNLTVRDAENRKIGSMRVLHDVTAEKEIEEIKSNFVSVASHQLRTPLSGIKWALSALRGETLGPLTEKQAKLLSKTNETNDYVISLLNDLLDVSRIEEERFGYVFRNTDIQSLTDEVLKNLQANIQANEEVSVIFKKSPTTIPLVPADKKKLKIAISNIIDNALKYTTKGSIHITLKKTPVSITISVKDTGIGIPINEQNLLFTKFFRAKNAMRRQTEGSGLGLWIANEIVKKHNGTITVNSKENQGSTFSITLPIAQKSS